MNPEESRRNNRPYSAVVTYHTNPFTCGVARFSKSLAEAMAVPLIPVSNFGFVSNQKVLLSLKFEEVDEFSAQRLINEILATKPTFDLFLHTISGLEIQDPFVKFAHKVFVGSQFDADCLRTIRPDVINTFAPGAGISGEISRPDLVLLTFGMAHKVLSPLFESLGRLFANDPRSVQLQVTTALHEGASFDESFFAIGDQISNLFQREVCFLGFLTDQEVSRRMLASNGQVSFFPKGVRENNTTVLSAMGHGSAVITNLDEYSPEWMIHGESVFDIHQLKEFPSVDELERVGKNAMLAVAPYTFSSLAKLF